MALLDSGTKSPLGNPWPFPKPSSSAATWRPMSCHPTAGTSACPCRERLARLPHTYPCQRVWRRVKEGRGLLNGPNQPCIPPSWPKIKIAVQTLRQKVSPRLSVILSHPSRLAEEWFSLTPLIPLPIIGFPFNWVRRYQVGPRSKSAHGHEYVLVLLDYATRYAEVVPMYKATC